MQFDPTDASSCQLYVIISVIIDTPPRVCVGVLGAKEKMHNHTGTADSLLLFFNNLLCFFSFGFSPPFLRWKASDFSCLTLDVGALFLRAYYFRALIECACNSLILPPINFAM